MQFVCQWFFNEQDRHKKEQKIIRGRTQPFSSPTKKCFNMYLNYFLLSKGLKYRFKTYGRWQNLSTHFSGFLYPQQPQPLTPHSCSLAPYQPFYLKRHLQSKARICFYLIKIGRHGKNACKKKTLLQTVFPYRAQLTKEYAKGEGNCKAFLVQAGSQGFSPPLHFRLLSQPPYHNYSVACLITDEVIVVTCYCFTIINAFVLQAPNL